MYVVFQENVWYKVPIPRKKKQIVEIQITDYVRDYEKKIYILNPLEFQKFGL